MLKEFTSIENVIFDVVFTRDVFVISVTSATAFGI
jgi:hypothetical protein